MRRATQCASLLAMNLSSRDQIGQQIQTETERCSCVGATIKRPAHDRCTQGAGGLRPSREVHEDATAACAFTLPARGPGGDAAADADVVDAEFEEVKDADSK